MGRWMDEWTDDWMVVTGRVGKLINEKVGWMDRLIEVWMNEKIYFKMDG